MKENFIFWFIFAIILVICVYTIILVRFFLKRISDAEKRNIISQNNSAVMKLRFQAFERFTLLLERLSPESLILREQNPKITGYAFHAQLLKVVRHEFNHNMAMQIYISWQTWDKIKTAKEKLLMLINSSIAKIKPDSPALELGKIIIEDAANEVNQYFKIAVESIRKEMEEMKI